MRQFRRSAFTVLAGFVEMRQGKKSSLFLCVSVVKISFRVFVVSVLEVSDAGQDHRQTVFVGSRNDFLIPLGASRLNNGSNS